jgi:N-acetylglucosamine-6-phosphate deacetylase
MSRTFLTGARLVLPDRVVSGRTLVIEAGRVADLTPAAVRGGNGDRAVALDGRIVVPGFIDAHVHGNAGADVLDGTGAVAAVAARLPRWGVTAFSPTSMACPADVLSTFLDDVRDARRARPSDAARVLPAHLESSFISPAYRGAQPGDCLCTPATGADRLSVMTRHRDDIGIVTVAPELEGGLDLVTHLVGMGWLVSVGHSGATFEQARAAFNAGASRATHLFNAMRPLDHREPGVVGAVLAHEHVHAEIICDACHVHPAVVRLALAAKGADRILAITDGTAASGLPAGTRARLGGRAITAADVARLDDGTVAGSVLTMDRAFATLVTRCQVDLVTAARLCATVPAADLRLNDRGAIVTGLAADLTVLDADLAVAETWIDGERAWRRAGDAPSETARVSPRTRRDR